MKNRKFGILILIVCSLFFSLPMASAMERDVIFYMHPDLVDDTSATTNLLAKYVEDMNYVLAKNTNQSLLFDPATGLILTDTKPHTGSGGTLPRYDYDVWAYVQPSTWVKSHGGTMSFDISGAAVLDNLMWLAVYDRDTLTDGSFETEDYWIQIDHMLHEFAHVFGAGNSEYYNLAQVNDATGIEPLLNIRLTDPDDSYWNTRTEYFTDPLLQMIYNKDNVGNPTSRTDLLNTIAFAPLTAEIMKNEYRNPSYPHPMPDMDNIALTVLDENTLMPVDGAQVVIWRVRSFSPYYNEIMVDSTTDANGNLEFAWGGGNPHSNYNHLRLIKVSKDGHAASKYYSKFDAEEVSNLDGNDNIFMTMYLTQPGDITPPESVTNLHSPAKSHDGIQWNWDNPADSDFSQAMVYIDGVLVQTSASNTYHATGLSPEKSYTITVHTKDTTGNENRNDVSNTQTTDAAPDTIIITKATYNTSKSKLVVVAVGTEPSAELTVVGYGVMKNKQKIEAWKYTGRGVADPGETITVVSSSGGSGTATVIHK